MDISYSRNRVPGCEMDSLHIGRANWNMKEMKLISN